jgi:hypothetical protein
MAARTAFVIALALNIVNREQSQQIVNPSGLPMCQDSVHRDQVFANLNKAMTEAGLTSADILRESAALDAALEAGQGFVTMNQDGSYIYNNNNISEPEISQEEQTLFQKFVEIFRQLKNCLGGTFELLREMNLWEQLNALLLASGLIGFATQCVKLGSCVADFSYSVANATLGAVKYAKELLVGGIQVSKKGKTEAIIKTTLNGLITEAETNRIDSHTNIGPQLYQKLINMNEISPEIIQLLKNNPPVFPRDLLRYRTVSESQTSDWGIIDGGRPRTKRRRNKGKSSKRRRPHKSSKKRRHYKTKKRVYRSTRFRTHR